MVQRWLNTVAGFRGPNDVRPITHSDDLSVGPSEVRYMGYLTRILGPGQYFNARIDYKHRASEPDPQSRST